MVTGMTTVLQANQLVLGAARSFRGIARAASGTALDVPTPCQDWDLGALLRHLLFYAPVLAASGRRADPPSGPAGEQDIVLDARWPEVLADAVDDVALAWGDPLAWSGSTSMAGSEPLPAPMIGGMVLGELVVHGWDLAMAAGFRPEYSGDVLTGTEQAVVQMAEMGRGMGIFGPEIIVGAGASMLDRIVARTGRAPGWRGSALA
jgi:uncharacterized protein (TIGR03086 family)